MKSGGSEDKLYLNLCFQSDGEGVGIPWVGAECVDIRRDTRGEGGLLDSN